MLMLASQSQNLPPVLELTEAAYDFPAAQWPPVGRDRLARRAGHLASCVRFGLDEPESMWRLHGVTGDLADVSGLDVLLPKVLDGALSLMGADFGNIQLLDPVTGSLRIVTQSGFGPEFLEYFAVVDDGHSACGRAAQECAQAVITDVTADPGFAPHRDIAAASGFRAVQSTPLVDYAGRLIGMVSTHFRRPGRPPAPDLQIMELYGDFAGEAVARHLGVPDGDGTGDPVAPAVITALLDPGNGQAADVTGLPGPGDAQDGREAQPAGRPASLEETMSRFAGDIVNRLFSAGMSLESAHSIVGNGPAGDRVAAATDELDRLIRDIRTMIFSPGDREQHAPGRGPER
jgi:GAF domain